MDRLRGIVADISNPRSPMYAKYLSSEEIELMTRPDERDVRVVTRWLQVYFFMRFLMSAALASASQVSSCLVLCRQPLVGRLAMTS